jgi:hypothetical protein
MLEPLTAILICSFCGREPEDGSVPTMSGGFNGGAVICLPCAELMVEDCREDGGGVAPTGSAGVGSNSDDGAAPASGSPASACSWCSADYAQLAERLASAGWKVTPPAADDDVGLPLPDGVS